MKILVVSSHEQQFGGGEGRMSFEFAVELSKRHEVTLVFPGKDAGILPPGASLKVYPVRSLDYTLPAMTGGEIRALFRFLDSYRPDVIHSHTPWFLGVMVQLWAFRNGVPFYFTAHELPSKILGWGMIRYMSGLLQSSFMRVLASTYIVSFCRHCTGVVALNTAAAEDIRGIGYRGRLYIIPNGRTLALYDGHSPTPISRMEKVLTFVGDVIPRKNQKYLVAVLRHLPENYRLLLIGHDVDHQYRRQIDASMGASLRGRVTFAGRLDHAQVPRHLALTSLWVSASLREVQSLAVMEALASGTPVLGLSNETIDQLVDEQVGRRLSRDATPEEFARAVRELCETGDDDYEQMCNAARQRVRPFDWAHNMDLTEQMYAGSAGRRGSSRRGTLAIPLILAVAQMLMSLLILRILRLRTLFESLAAARRAHARA